MDVLEYLRGLHQPMYKLVYNILLLFYANTDDFSNNLFVILMFAGLIISTQKGKMERLVICGGSFKFHRRHLWEMMQ